MKGVRDLNLLHFRAELLLFEGNVPYRSVVPRLYNGYGALPPQYVVVAHNPRWWC